MNRIIKLVNKYHFINKKLINNNNKIIYSSNYSNLRFFSNDNAKTPIKNDKNNEKQKDNKNKDNKNKENAKNQKDIKNNEQVIKRVKKEMNIPEKKVGDKLLRGEAAEVFYI